MTDLCAMYELPVDQCAHCQGHEAPDDRPVRVSQPVAARYDSRCAHCGEPIHNGVTEIALADVQGNGISAEWCIADHTTDPEGDR